MRIELYLMTIKGGMNMSIFISLHRIFEVTENKEGWSL